MVEISTGKGDKGTTKICNISMRKNDPRVEAFGAIDELNSILGCVLSFSNKNDFKEKIKKIQKDLYLIGVDLEKDTKEISKKHIEKLEKIEEKLEKELPKLKDFILPGGTKTASLLHFSRSVCRRCERKVVHVKEKQNFNQNILIYLNRLSDLLYLMARKENFNKKIKEKKLR